MLRAAEAEGVALSEILFRERTLALLRNTLVLGAAVLGAATALAVPYAWLTSRADLRFRRAFVVLGMLPLAVPGYVLATAMLGVGGDYGLAARLFAVSVWRPSGLLGATVILTLYTFPYLFLNLRAALVRTDPAQEEAARTLGLSRARAFFRVTLPQLRPAYLAGAMLILLHVIGDFGVVSLVRFETLSFAVYTQYESAFDRTLAAWLALILVALAAVLLAADAFLLRGRRAEALSARPPRATRDVDVGRWRLPAYAFLAAVPFFGALLPVATLVTWSLRAEGAWAALGKALASSAGLAGGAALLAPVLAFPLIHASVRRSGRLARLGERLPYLGYSVPPIAFGLALVLLSRGTAFYQTTALLLAAVTLRFLAEAVGPLRSALYLAPPRLEEAARALGHGPFAVVRKVTLPLLWRGVAASMALVFLAVVKELPLTLLLGPIGFRTLATNVWRYTEDAMFAQAAPHALAIVALAGLFVAGLLRREARR